MDNVSDITPRVKKRKREKSVRYFDYGLLMIAILLIGFGLLMLYSSSSYEASLEFGDSAHYLKRQIRAIIVGAAFSLFLININYLLIEKLSVIAYFFSVVFCISVIFLGTAQGTSSRWFYIGGISVQPSEVCKVAVIIFVASMIYRHSGKLSDYRFIFKMFAFIMPAFIVVGYNNLSTAIIIFGIAYIMLLIAGRQYWLFAMIAGLGAAVMTLYISLYGYRSERLEIWKDPANHPNGGQVIQGLYAIGRGGLFGKGLGESILKQGYVPEAQNDMIFSIICEELGILGALCVIVLYMLLVWRLLVIAINAKELFGSFVAIGIMVHISLQVILNIAVVTNTIPNTGVTLPFISYGGTSVSILVAEIGLALGISRGIYLK